jgi:hypothetical protein
MVLVLVVRGRHDAAAAEIILVYDMSTVVGLPHTSLSSYITCMRLFCDSLEFSPQCILCES